MKLLELLYGGDGGDIGVVVCEVGCVGVVSCGYAGWLWIEVAWYDWED